MANQADINDHERGLQANTALGATYDILKEQEEKVLKKLISTYRSGEATYEVLLGGIAELNALDLFYTECLNRKSQGNRALERMERNG